MRAEAAVDLRRAELGDRLAEALPDPLFGVGADVLGPDVPARREEPLEFRLERRVGDGAELLGAGGRGVLEEREDAVRGEEGVPDRAHGPARRVAEREGLEAAFERRERGGRGAPSRGAISSNIRCSVSISFVMYRSLSVEGLCMDRVRSGGSGVADEPFPEEWV